ncbi:MAG: histidine phosphatase family protein [Burkholderiales bacterium]
MSISLFILRHATAQDHAAGLPDDDRALVAKGEKQSRDVARFCAQHGLLPERLLSSPVRRAWQTATLLHEQLPDCPAPQATLWLSTRTDATQIQQGLAGLWQGPAPVRDGERIFLVGHEPHLSHTLALLLGSERLQVEVKKASLTHLAIDSSPAQPRWPAARLCWSLPCALMR